MEYTNDFVIKPINDTILVILCQLRHNNNMWKTVRKIVILVLGLVGVFYLG